MNQGGLPFYLHRKTRLKPKEGYAINKHTPDENLNTAARKTECLQSIDELARRGAHQMILAALEAEVEDYLECYRALRDQRGHARVVRNGKSRERTFTLSVGPLQIQAPRVNDRRGGHAFHSAVLPLICAAPPGWRPPCRSSI